MTHHTRQLPTSLCTIILVAAFAAEAAFASGYMFAPESRHKLPSFKDCLVQLQLRASEHRNLVKLRTFKPDGGFLEVNIQPISDGVEITGRNSARYAAKIWYHNGRIDRDGRQYEVNHSWDESRSECRGKIMITNKAQGYTLSTFEPVSTNESR